MIVFQLRIRVSDGGSPEQTAEVRMYVQIRRDRRDPKFSNAPYNAQLDENVAVDSVVAVKPSTVRATDDDRVGEIRSVM